MAALSIHHRGCTSHAEQPRRGCHVLDVQRLPLRMIPQQQQQLVVRGAAARPSRWMKVVESHEYTWLFGYNGESQQQHQTASSATTVQQLAAETHITEQQLAQEIANAADWTDLLQLATEYQEWLTLELQLRLLFRLFVSLYEVNWQAADMEELLADAIPPLLAAAAANLSALLDKLPEDTDPPQQQQQQRLAGQLADMLYALAVLATAANEDAVAAAGAWGRDSTSSTGENAGSSSSSSGGGGGSSSSSSSGAVHCRWYQSTAMQQLLDAVAAVGSSWDMTCVSRKDAVSLLWAYGKLLQLQQQLNGQSHSTAPLSTASITGSSSTANSRPQFIAALCDHLSLLIQLSNNTADPTAASASPQNPPQLSLNHSSSALTEPWHPEDLTDAVTGLAAAAAAASPGQVGPGFQSQAAAGLLDAAAHEVYRQLSNRHSTAGTFTVDGVVLLLEAYCDLDYKDGPSLRMFDAAAGWVVKRVRARHMQAPSSPQQLAAVAGVFARLQHRSVVVPELLNALGSQACKAAAAAVELAAEDPWSYHTGGSSSYCRWVPQHAATLLQSHVSLGYRPADLLLSSILTALVLHWEHQRQHTQHTSVGVGVTADMDTEAQSLQLGNQGHEQMQYEEAGQRAGSGTAARQQSYQQLQQQQWQAEGQLAEAVVPWKEQLEQQVAAVQILDVLSQLQYHPGDRVLQCLLQAAWADQPHQHLSHSQLVTLLFSSTQLTTNFTAQPHSTATALSAHPNSQAPLGRTTNAMCGCAALDAAATAIVTQEAVAAVADELILSTMPDQEQQQQGEQQRQQKLDVSSLIRVLWALCVYSSSLDIARYGWLLVAIAGGQWQRLSEEQLCVIKQGQLLLGQDGADMAEEVLPAQLLKRVEAAWAKHCKQHSDFTVTQAV